MAAEETRVQGSKGGSREIARTLSQESRWEVMAESSVDGQSGGKWLGIDSGAKRISWNLGRGV